MNTVSEYCLKNDARLEYTREKMVKTFQLISQNLFVRDFSAIPNEGVVDWKKEYKETYLRRRAAEDRSRNLPPFWHDPLPHNPFNHDNPFAPTAPFAPPGFLGGDRDLFPEGVPFPHDPFGGAGRGAGPGAFQDPLRPDLFRPLRPQRPQRGPRFPGGPNLMRPRWPGPGGGSGGFF